MHKSQQSSPPNLNKCSWSSSRLSPPLLSLLLMSQATMAPQPSTTSTTYSSPFFCLLVSLFNLSPESSPPHWHKRLAYQSRPTSELSIYLHWCRITEQKLLPTNPHTQNCYVSKSRSQNYVDDVGDVVSETHHVIDCCWHGDASEVDFFFFPKPQLVR